MINNKWDITPLIGAKLKEIKIGENEFTLIFDNERTLTTLLSINISEIAIVPKAEFICGYHNKKTS